MKKKNIKPLVLSALAALSLGSISVAGTFALFTDKAETTVEVASGKIDISTSITNLNVWELGETPVSADSAGDYVDTIGGKTHLEGNTFTLSKWAPGDGMKFKVVPTNDSNVRTKIRLKVVMSGDLSPALTLQVKDTNETQLMAARGNRSLYTDWIPVDPSNNPSSCIIQVDFLNHGTEITAREVGEDNQYQNKTANIVVIYEAVQANADVETSLLEIVNTKLATDQVNEGKNATMYDAVQDYLELDTLYDESDLAPYYWDSSEDLFVESVNVVASKAHTYFKMYDAMPNPQPAHSVYASEDWNGSGTISLTGIGFDVGNNSDAFTSISYSGATDARTNIIRTNSLFTNVMIDAEKDTIKRYGSAGIVNIVAVFNESYHEYGKVAFLQIASGRVALEKESEVAQLHFAYNETEKKFDEIIVAYDEEVELPTFSRDAVPLSDIQDEAKLVVELQNSTVIEEAESDFVWLFQQGLKEQMRVSDSAEAAGNVKATDSSVKVETSKAAEEIANNFTSTAQEYTAEQIAAGEIAVADIAESGIETEEKEEIMNTVVEEAVSEVVAKEDEGFVARIKTKGYYSLGAAIDEALPGEVIDLLADCSYTVSDARSFSIRRNGFDDGVTAPSTNTRASVFNLDVTESGKIITYTSSIGPAQASIGSTYYTSLRRAINAASENDTVVVLVSQSFENNADPIVISKDITLDTNHFRINFENVPFKVNDGIHLTLQGRGNIDGATFDALKASGTVTVKGGNFIARDPVTLDASLAEENSEYFAINYVQNETEQFLVSDRAYTKVIKQTTTEYTPVHDNYTISTTTNELASFFSGLPEGQMNTVCILPGNYVSGSTIYCYAPVEVIGLGDKEDVAVEKPAGTSYSNRHLFNFSNRNTVGYDKMTIRNFSLSCTGRTLPKSGKILGEDNGLVQFIGQTKGKAYDLLLSKTNGNEGYIYINGNNTNVDGVKYRIYAHIENCKIIENVSFYIFSTNGSWTRTLKDVTYNNGALSYSASSWVDKPYDVWDW